jgi:hypothetical protein
VALTQFQVRGELSISKDGDRSLPPPDMYRCVVENSNGRLTRLARLNHQQRPAARSVDQAQCSNSRYTTVHNARAGSILPPESLRGTT